MNKIFSPLSTIIVLISVFFSSVALSQCVIEDKIQTEAHQSCLSMTTSDLNSIDAMSFLPIENGFLRVSGDVCIGMAEQRIATKELLYHDKNQIVKVENPLIYWDKKQTINAQSAKIDMQNNSATMSDVKYILNDTKANGKADELTVNKKTSHLTALTYSTCPQNDQQWYIQAQTADIDPEKQVGTFRNMTLKFKGVPILYLPYAKMPLSNQRQSGFLIPEIANSSTNGFGFALPYYINIAENMDATITPRYLSKRGLMLETQFRYLGADYYGEIYADYLPSDEIDNIDRGFVEYKHRQKFSSHWSMNTRLNHVSDRAYFEDFGNSIYDTSQAYLYSFLNLNGNGDNWRFRGQLNDYQIISDSIALTSQPYQRLPSLEYSWFSNDLTDTLNYGVDSTWVSFYREQSITTTRLDLIPYIEKTFQNNYSRLTPRLAYRYTNWDFANEDNSSITNLENSRALPIASLDYNINFEKQFDDGSFSSIEPRLYYLYAPFRNQQNIPLFDTRDLTFGTGLLYQANAFSGADRQSDANQLSLGISQRHFDVTGNEQWNVTVGQIAYFDDRKVQLDDSVETQNSSPIITEFNYFYRNWKASMSVHWDTRLDKAERALVKFQRKGDNNSLFNFAYRFRQGKIEQLDSSVVLPIGANNRFIARWNYSIDANKTIEAIAGFEHKNCCWATRVVARRYVINEQGDVNNGIFFELQLNGLGAIGRNPRRLLKQSILGYSEEF